MSTSAHHHLQNTWACGGIGIRVRLRTGFLEVRILSSPPPFARRSAAKEERRVPSVAPFRNNERRRASSGWQAHIQRGSGKVATPVS